LRTLGACGLLLLGQSVNGNEGRNDNFANLRFDDNGIWIHLEFCEPVSLIKLGSTPPFRIILKHKETQVRISHKHLTMWMGNSFARIPRTPKSRTFDFFLSREDLGLFVGKNANEEMEFAIITDKIAKGDFQMAREILGDGGSCELDFYVPAATGKLFEKAIYQFQIQVKQDCGK
jgi:hypothetical protein